MSQSNLPRDIEKRIERRWAQKLQEQIRSRQIRSWKDARPSFQSMTDTGVPVVRRGKRKVPVPPRLQPA